MAFANSFFSVIHRTYICSYFVPKTPSEIFQRTFLSFFIAFPEFGKVWKIMNRI